MADFVAQSLYGVAAEGLMQLTGQDGDRVASLALGVDAHGLVLSLTGCGAGLDPAHARPALRAALARAELLGGVVDWSRQKVGGTRLRLRLPSSAINEVPGA